MVRFPHEALCGDTYVVLFLIVKINANKQQHARTLICSSPFNKKR